MGSSLTVFLQLNRIIFFHSSLMTITSMMWVFLLPIRFRRIEDYLSLFFACKKEGGPKACLLVGGTRREPSNVVKP